jgi:hypothetical protein
VCHDEISQERKQQNTDMRCAQDCVVTSKARMTWTPQAYQQQFFQQQQMRGVPYNGVGHVPTPVSGPMMNQMNHL